VPVAVAQTHDASEAEDRDEREPFQLRAARAVPKRR
jgi:hypothetical protein